MMLRLMADSTEYDQIIKFIVAEIASLCVMVYVQGHRPTSLSEYCGNLRLRLLTRE
jgi:hypothetical protein